MIVYQATKSEFLHQVHHVDIEELIQEAFARKLGRQVGPPEIRSWQSSLQSMARHVQGGSKKVLIVEGGPGTGKSVLAINLLVALTKLGQNCRYVAKNAAPRAVYASKLKKVRSVKAKT